MSGEHWLVAVLKDLNNFAKENDLPEVVAKLGETKEIAEAELQKKCQSDNRL